MHDGWLFDVPHLLYVVNAALNFGWSLVFYAMNTHMMCVTFYVLTGPCGKMRISQLKPRPPPSIATYNPHTLSTQNEYYCCACVCEWIISRQIGCVGDVCLCASTHTCHHESITIFHDIFRFDAKFTHYFCFLSCNNTQFVYKLCPVWQRSGNTDESNLMG